MLLATWLYAAAVVVESAGAALGVFDLSKRVRNIRRYRRPVGTSISIRWQTEAVPVSQLLKDREPMLLAADLRAAVDRVTAALEDERQERSDAEARVAALAGVGENLTPLWVSAGLLLVGVLLGGVANVIASLAS
jgi:hypothetical protein